MMMGAFQFQMLYLDQECAHKLSTWSLTWITFMKLYSIYKKNKEVQGFKFV